jgi:hypothetical protein
MKDFKRSPPSARARAWVGLKNSDFGVLRLDLKAEVFVNYDTNPPIASSQVNNVRGGSSGFNNAVLSMIPLALTGGPVTFPESDPLMLRIFVRRTCSGGGHNSGTVRLWYGGRLIDSGASRDAGSRFDATIDGTTSDYFLRTGFAISTTAGTSKTSIDAAVNSTGHARTGRSRRLAPGALRRNAGSLSAMAHPNFSPVSPRYSRTTEGRGASSGPSSLRASPCYRRAPFAAGGHPYRRGMVEVGAPSVPFPATALFPSDTRALLP